MKKIFILALVALIASISLAANTQKQIRFVDENGDVRTDITSVTVRDLGTTTASTLTTDEAGSVSITNPMTTTSTNTGLDAGNGIITFCSAASSYDIKMTIGGVGVNLYSIPATKKQILLPFMLGPVVFNDAEALYFGDDKDISISQSAAGLLTIGQSVAGTGSVAVGVDDAGIDWTFYGDTTLLNMMWDASANVLSFTGGNSMIEFGGAVVDVSETTLAVVEPTASNVVTIPDATGTVQLQTAATTVIAPDTTATITVVPGTDTLYTYTIDTDNEDCTLTFSAGGTAGDRATIIFITDAAGSADEVMTFDGTLAMSEGTLTLANAASNRYVVSFISDGTVWMETSRTAILP